MTEHYIREMAAKYGLEVLKRITTGHESKGHFATFELSGPRASEAWQEMRDQGRGPGFDSLRPSGIDGALYIECDSVWCDAISAAVS